MESSTGGCGGGGERQREHPFVVTEPSKVARAKKNGLDYLFHLYEQCRVFLLQVQSIATSPRIWASRRAGGDFGKGRGSPVGRRRTRRAARRVRLRRVGGAAEDEAVHAPGEVPQRGAPCLARSGVGQAQAKAMSALPARRRRHPRGAVYLLGGIVMVSSHSGQLRGCVGNAVAAWPAAVCFGNQAVTKQGCQWRHSGAAGGSWLLLVLLVVELGWRRWP